MGMQRRRRRAPNAARSRRVWWDALRRALRANRGGRASPRAARGGPSGTAFSGAASEYALSRRGARAGPARGARTRRAASGARAGDRGGRMSRRVVVIGGGASGTAAAFAARQAGATVHVVIGRPGATALASGALDGPGLEAMGAARAGVVAFLEALGAWQITEAA